VKLSEIETSVPIGRTLEGRTITVRDLLDAFATVSGTRLGSQEFDRALTDPAQLHARGTIDNAARYSVLRALLKAAQEQGPRNFEPQAGSVSLQSVSVSQATAADGGQATTLTIELSGQPEPGLGIDQALDNLARP
jgi:hypothetical protein